MLYPELLVRFKILSGMIHPDLDMATSPLSLSKHGESLRVLDTAKTYSQEA